MGPTSSAHETLRTLGQHARRCSAQGACAPPRDVAHRFAWDTTSTPQPASTHQLPIPLRGNRFRPPGVVRSSGWGINRALVKERPSFRVCSRSGCTATMHWRYSPTAFSQAVRQAATTAPPQTLPYGRPCRKRHRPGLDLRSPAGSLVPEPGPRTRSRTPGDPTRRRAEAHRR